MCRFSHLSFIVHRLLSVELLQLILEDVVGMCREVGGEEEGVGREEGGGWKLDEGRVQLRRCRGKGWEQK